MKDSELIPGQKDEFRHEDIAKNVINIIENERTPYNIALVGRWGIGKSSLSNMIKRHLEKNPEEYIVEEINAWKYEKEALRKVFLKKILAKLGYRDKSFASELSEKLSCYIGQAEESEMTLCDYWKEWKPLLAIAAIIYVIGVGVSFIGHILSGGLDGNYDWLGSLISSFTNNFYLPILVVLIQQFIKVTSKKVNFKLSTPIKSTDEYEEQLKEILENNNKTIITIVDDLDRLTPDKIVEALDAIKAFVNYDKCIFIVPFDDMILKKALKNKTISLNKNEHLLIESELFLDKLFQYKIYLPNVIASDLPQYALELIETEAIDLFHMFKPDQLESIVKEILIHKGVTTPRQVKKIINAFAHLCLLAARRENDRVPEGTFFSDEGVCVLAKVAVLQADFSDFYRKLFDDPDLMDAFLQTVKSIDEQESIEIPEPLEAYFISDEKDGKTDVRLTTSAEQLYMFLSRTSNVICENKKAFLYLDYDSISAKFGSELSRDLRDAFSSGAVEIVRDRINRNKSKDLTKLIYDIISNAEAFDYEHCCEVFINVYSEYGFDSDKGLCELVANRITSIYNSGRSLDAKNVRFDHLCGFKTFVTEQKGLELAIQQIMLTDDDGIVERLNYFFSNHSEFENNTKEKVKSYIRDYLGEEGKLSISDFCGIESIDIHEHFSPYLNNELLLKKVAEEISSLGTYDKEDMEVRILSGLLEEYIINNTFINALNTLFENLSDEDLFVILFDTILKGKDQIDGDLSNAFVTLITAYKGVEAKEKGIQLLTLLEWSIDKKITDQADDFFSIFLSYESIDGIILNIFKHGQMGYIPRTIDAMLESFIENEVDYSTLSQIQNQLTETQRKKIITNITNHTAYGTNMNGEKFEVIGRILDTLAEYEPNHDLINAILIPSLYSNITQYAHLDFSVKSATLLPSIVAVINDVQKQQFLNWSTTPTNIKNYPSLTSSVLNAFAEYLTEQHASSVAAITKLPDLKLDSSILCLLRLFREKFNNNELDGYAEYLVSAMTNDALRNMVIEDIDWFVAIDNLPDFIKNGIGFEDTYEQFKNVVVKFLNEDKQADDILDTVLSTNNSADVKRLYSIITEVIKDVPSYLSTLVEKCSEQGDLLYVKNIMSIKLLNGSDFDIELLKLTSILFKQGDTALVDDVVTELLNMHSHRLQLQERDEWANNLYNLFRSIESSSIKEKIYQLASEIGVKNIFKKDKRKKQKDFSEEELMIIEMHDK